MRFTILYMFTDLISDYGDSGFDRNGVTEEGYTYDEAIAKVMSQAITMCHDNAEMKIEGAWSVENGQSFRVTVSDNLSHNYWTLCTV